VSAFLLAFLLLAPGPGAAERAYAAGRFEEAYTLFQAALDRQDAPQGALLFNLGNCAYRLGRYAEAVLLFRRARLRMPRDPEVRFNLFLAEQPLGLQSPPSASLRAGLDELLDALTAAELLFLAGGLQAAGLLGLVLLRGRKGWRAAMALAVLLGLAGSGRLAWSLWGGGPREGLVLAPTLEVRPGPHLELEPTLRLRAGERVTVGERSDRWVRIIHERGGGWARSPGVGVVE